MALTCDNIFAASRRKDLGHTRETGIVRPKVGPILKVARDRGATEGTYGSADPGRNAGRQGRKDVTSIKKTFENYDNDRLEKYHNIFLTSKSPSKYSFPNL